jgi:hypothetical protein
MDKAIRYARFLTFLFILPMVVLMIGAFVHINAMVNEAVL